MRKLIILLLIAVLTTIIYPSEITVQSIKSQAENAWKTVCGSAGSEPVFNVTEIILRPLVYSAAPAAENPVLKPGVLSDYPSDQPAPNIPLLRWTRIPGSVYYEVEFLTAPPENPNSLSPSVHQFNLARPIFTNGYCLDLSSYAGDHLYWRVRAFDWDGNPIGAFSDAAQLYIDHNLPQILQPLSNTGYKAANVPMPLYPVYSWLPVYGAVLYQVELTDAPPENPNGTGTSVHQIRLYSIKGTLEYYDEKALSTPGTYYWRVRGLDQNGNPVGVFSDAEEFRVSLEAGRYAATIGDSITHGGGGISYSPADCEFSYQTYLSFPTMNLAYSGDTSETVLARFNSDVLPFQPKYLIIMDGSNSLRQGVPASQVIQDLADIRNKCLINNIRPIFLTLPPINPDRIQRAFNQPTVPKWQEEYARVNAFIRQQTYFIDIEPYFTDADGNLPSCYGIDGIHLDIEGKKLMARIINENWPQVTR